jgi:hypothetical protein
MKDICGLKGLIKISSDALLSKRLEMVVYKYKKLMECFINEDITIEEFERNYLKTFKNETERIGSPLFEILNGVFEAVDRYWHECLPGEETAFEISEEQLRKEVHEALVKLSNLFKILTKGDTNKFLMCWSSSLFFIIVPLTKKRT